MIPISQIKIGDQFQNPVYGYQGNIYYVEDIDIKEKMVKIQAYSSSNFKPIMKPFWKSNKDRLFSESWRMN